ncbi:hypothetical protein [Anabaena sp. CCY 9910]|uniref:hypothetical protein n=1 Tax=Anabaena sp. CCY 9910 TaxID=3103870 RepID=UPI0039E0552A
MIELTRLKWSKNVNYQSEKVEYWDYRIDEVSKIVILHWRKGQEENARKPKEGDLLIIRQHAHVTHIVKFFNNTIYYDGSDSEFSTGRLIQIIWKANDLKNLVHTSHLYNLPHNTEVFGCPVVFPPNGKAHSLESINIFNEYWSKHGGMVGFHNYVKGVLDKKGEWLQPLIELELR